ncbi:hypothetical protein LOD99_3274 [Oopsacas minuta]|uniref:Uncharacterized protein n=1 Tax=Oopsacas minuta TaxID=111878 RepID=A0AAV7JZJ1_9METZ|nr:hypothetical protein LOD99_3274 [Oopsacas minuta]
MDDPLKFMMIQLSAILRAKIITRKEYDTRLNRLDLEYAIAWDKLETMGADDIKSKCNEMEHCYAIVEGIVTFTFVGLFMLHKDSRSLKYLVNKNKEDKLLKEVHNGVFKEIRHYYDNKIDIPSFTLDIYGNAIKVAPPKVIKLFVYITIHK